jgi:transcriptional regulator with XRE-family HTH domain
MMTKTTKIYIKLGQRIRILRQKRAVSQEALAAQVGVHRTYVGAIERGEKGVSIEILQTIAGALDLPLWELFKF